VKAMIFGAGKIARGFIGHLLYLSKVPFILVDVNEPLIEELNQRKSYHVHVMGNHDKDVEITDFKGILCSDFKQIADEWQDAAIAFTSVGGKNLSELGKVIAEAFIQRCQKGVIHQPFNIVTCENWQEPAEELRTAIHSHLPEFYAELFDRWVGISEAVVMRSGVEPTQDKMRLDSLCVYVSDYWELPINKQKFKGELLSINGLRYLDQFAGFLERKFYTYNAANGTVAYLGYLRKHQHIFEAASDPKIVEVLDAVYQETGKALIAKHGVAADDQIAFAISSKRKLQDRNIIDFVERNARDPIRKLGYDDRLVGSARIAMQYGIEPHALCLAIAAAIFYDEPTDSIAQQLHKLRKEEGIDSVLRKVCKLPTDHTLSYLIKEKIQGLKKEGWMA
jgi:mannitol-1-phosphate 5-dehydrogenase